MPDISSSRESDAVLRVLIIGRISTPHQNEENIEASYRYVEEQLRKMHSGPLQIKHLGERASGMLAERQTIREAEDLISTGRVDMVVAEDLSRIFRNPRHQLNFVQDAVDARVRVLCLADNLDTSNDNWELMLSAAGLRHGLFVSDTRRRVRRTATHSFHGGGMVMKVRYGYRKLTKEQAASGEFGPKGLRLTKVVSCTPTIRQMREHVLAGKSYSYIADWLNQQSITPGPYAKAAVWTAKLVADFLRAPILHGERTFRIVIHQPVLRTGKHRREANPNPERELRAELAHFSSEEHDELLLVMSARSARRRSRRGKDHPRYRIPRWKAIWPAQHLTCGVCHGLMYSCGKNLFKCSNTLHRGRTPCWNHVLVDSEIVRERALSSLLDALVPFPDRRESFLEVCWRTMEDAANAGGRPLLAVENEIHVLQQQAERLAKAIAEGGELAALLERLKEIQKAARSTEAVRDELRSAAQRAFRIDRENFWQNPLPTLVEQCGIKHEFADLLRQYIVEIAVVPVQDLLRGQVRPRIKATVQSLPAVDHESNADLGTRTVLFDVFDLPKHIRYVGAIAALRQEQPDASYDDIAASLSISTDVLKRALRYLRLMEAQNTSDPYVVLTSKPARASRWRDRGA